MQHVNTLRAALDKNCMKWELCRRVRNDTAGIVASRYAHAYADSDFCLMPEGDTFSRSGWFDALCALCIPVFFADCLESDLPYERAYEPFLPTFNRTAFGVGTWSVMLNASRVVDEPGDAQSRSYLERALLDISEQTKHELRQRIAQLVPQLQYSYDASVFGAGTLYNSIMDARRLRRERASLTSRGHRRIGLVHGQLGVVED